MDDLQTKDLRWLASVFAQEIDPSRIMQAVAQGFREHGRALEFLGEGSHFRAWGLPARDQTGGFRGLAIKQARPVRRSADYPGVRQLTRYLRQIRGFGGLLPPFEVFSEDDGEGLILAMPWGQPGTGGLAAHWQPLDQVVEGFRRDLKDQGFEIRDAIQLATIRGIPFIYDLSDIRPCASLK